MAGEGAATSFFRVFDLSFFLPGLIVTGALAQLPPFDQLADLAPKLDALDGIVTFLVAVAGMYLAGLLVHGLRSLMGSAACWAIRKVWPARTVAVFFRK